MPRAMFAGVLVVLIMVLGGVMALAGTMSYTIQYGDTLSELALEHDTDVETLAELNGIENPDLIIPGDELLIPVDDESTGPAMYTVKPGDTLGSIAYDLGVDVDELAALNNLSDPDLIVTGDKIALPDSGSEVQATTSDEGSASQPNSTEAADDQAPEGDSTNVAADGPEPSGAAGEIEVLSSGPAPVRLHLVKSDESLDGIAAQYDVTGAQILAANALSSDTLTAGTILKIPPADMDGIQLVGMPAAKEQWPLQSEIAAASVATSYWGEPVAGADLLATIPRSPNPHLGFRGDPTGMWGMTDDYGVYHEPLAEALRSYGFDAETFYSDGAAAVLQGWIDAGVPVVVWLTFGLEPQERMVIEDDLGRYSLIPEQHAMTVYGYDNDGVYAVDVASGEYVHLPWDPFLSSWSLFDGMGLAISVSDTGE